ncbi:MAG: polysaccharide deacetylase family protein [Lachnospiraceae bacterium]
MSEERKKIRQRRRETLKRMQERERIKQGKKAPGKKVFIVIAVCLLLCAIAGGTVFALRLQENNTSIKIEIAVESQSIVQDEELQSFVAKAISDTDGDKVINRNTGFTVQDLLDDLNGGIGYQINCDGDATTEGEFTIHAELDEYMKERVTKEWNDKVQIESVDGELVVKNKYGEWEGNKFKRYDGTYVSDDFIESKGDKYYFDADGNMVTGEVKLGFTTYVFDENGKMVSEVSTLDVDKPMVALTYDDGPGPRTGELLDTLEANAAHATFFMLGQRINDNNGDVVKRMVDIGCEVANHSYSHPQLTTLSEDAIKEEINTTNNKIMEKSGMAAKIVRPPYGSVNDTVRAAVGVPMIMWSVDTLDWKTKNAQATIDHVMNTVRDGDIILMHDIHDTTIDAAKDLIPKLKEAGYQLVTVSELAEARGVTMEAGQSYSEFWK